MPDLIGKTLGGFQIEALLGKGSMAQVYQARQIALRRQVALKVLEEGLFTSSDQIKRFLREAEAMAMLEHPHIVPIYAAGEDAPYYFFAMRLVRGGSVGEAMRTGIQRRVAVRWACEVCSALAYAHSVGVFHRDLKPSNVLIQDGVAVLADFGLARLRDFSTITQRGFILGTPMYMSPEQTRAEEIGPAADCFSLGVMIYEMLLGQHPFAPPGKRNVTRIEGRAELFDRIQKCDFASPSSIDPSVPQEVEHVILKSLTRTAKDRYPDGSAMLRDLEAAHKALAGRDELIQSAQPENAASPPPAPVRESSHLDETEAVSSESIQAEGQKPAPLHKGLERYRIEEEVGHGGQGVVYRAYDTVLHRDVALKVLKNRRAEDKRMEELFVHEARTAARLTHPNIIPVFDFGVAEKCLYITMQYVVGKSLDRLVEGGRALPPAYALEVLIQTTGALAYAHEQGVVHLDVKPANIMIGESVRIMPESILKRFGAMGSPHVYLLDFTMAAVRRAASQAWQESKHPERRKQRRGGTLAYAAPELLKGSDAPTPANDIFSLGVVLYEMLTGTRLFSGEDVSITRFSRRSAPVPLPSSKVKDIPPDLDALCTRMLGADPKQRPQKAREVAHTALKILESLGA